MPFIVTCPQPGGRLHARITPLGDIAWEPNRDKATRMTAAAADAVEADLRRFSDDDYLVEGIKDQSP